MKMYVRKRYLMARVGNPDNVAPLTKDEYDLLIGALSFLDKSFDVKTELTTVKDDENGQLDVYVTYTVRVY